jgi:hypothetical protein
MKEKGWNKVEKSSMREGKIHRVCYCRQVPCEAVIGRHVHLKGHASIREGRA